VNSPVKEHGRLDPAFTWSSLERASDERLLTLARGGLDVAVEAIVRRYQTTLIRYACRFLDPERAEAVAQEGLIKALAQLESDGKRVHLRSWLYRVVHNEAVDASRRRSDRDDSREDEDGEAKSAEYLARVERLRGIVIGINRPEVAYAQSAERSREDIGGDLAETRASVEVLISRARASLRSARGSLLPVRQLRNWFENLSTPALRGAVTAGAAAAVIAAVAGAATLGTHRGSLGSGSTQPSANSTSDSKPHVAGPRREGGTRTTSDEPQKGPRKVAPDQAPAPAQTAPPQITPTVAGGGVAPTPQPSQPEHANKPKKTKPSQGDSGEEVTVLGQKKGATGSGINGVQAPNLGTTGG
jgi:DNA-directed RNA polymerase specialized sigma24 family protein